VTPLLLVCPGNEALGESLCRGLRAEPVAFATRRFPDRETYLRIDSDVRGRPVAILCSLRDPDPLVPSLVFMTDTLRELGARSVGLVAPYLAYMRQDRRFQPGEALTSASFARLVSTQFDWLVTVDPHLHRHRSLDEIYTIPAQAVPAAPLVADWIRGHVTAPLVVGPDSESKQWVRAVAEAVPCPVHVLEKTRRGDRDVAISALPQAALANGSTAVLIDDIISSARTMIQTVRQWPERGATAPICIGVHGVFARGAYRALLGAGAAAIVTTNSIAHASNGIDLTAALVGPIEQRLRGA